MQRYAHIEANLRRICGTEMAVITRTKQGWFLIELPIQTVEQPGDGIVLNFTQPAYYAPPSAMLPNGNVDWAIASRRGIEHAKYPLGARERPAGRRR